ncbi:hypothetical protein PG989_015638 [Apiospora arundinis]
MDIEPRDDIASHGDAQHGSDGVDVDVEASGEDDEDDEDGWVLGGWRRCLCEVGHHYHCSMGGGVEM